jgi:hypothetical protein
VLTDFEQQALAKMSTALQALDDAMFNRSPIAARVCGEAVDFNRLVSRAIADERYRRELAEAEAAKELTE